MALHDEVNTLLHLPAGYIYSISSSFEKDSVGARGLRWSWLHPATNKTQIDDIAKLIKDAVALYPGLEEAHWTEFRDLLLVHARPMAQNAPLAARAKAAVGAAPAAAAPKAAA